jgi:hypothetical protein
VNEKGSGRPLRRLEPQGVVENYAIVANSAYAYSTRSQTISCTEVHDGLEKREALKIHDSRCT